MKNIFIINPTAGNGKFVTELLLSLGKLTEDKNRHIENYITKASGDAETYVRMRCQKALEDGNGEELRFFACGGDGTLNEVVNGAYGFENAIVGCVPLGTGNDFVRNFPEAGSFKDLEAQVDGSVREIDLIEYRLERDGEQITRYCANMFNIGFDCNVVDLTSRLKTYPLINGSLAYLLGVAIILIKKMGENLKIIFTDTDFAENERVHDGRLLLVAIANGCFCGGGIKGVPLAEPDDGLMDVSIVENVSRIQFIRLFGKYAKGTHLRSNGIDKIITYRKCRELTITPNNGTMRLCADGEITTEKTVSFQNVPKVIRFCVPAK